MNVSEARSGLGKRTLFLHLKIVQISYYKTNGMIRRPLLRLKRGSEFSKWQQK